MKQEQNEIFRCFPCLIPGSDITCGRCPHDCGMSFACREALKKILQREKDAGQDWGKIREVLLYAADSVILLKDIGKMNNCNDCGISRKCAYCPRPGESVRYNCPLWEPSREPKEG